jgi:hypothetical protein
MLDFVNLHGSDGGRATFDGPDRNGVDIEFVTQPDAGDRHRGRNIRNGLNRISLVGQQITSGGPFARNSSRLPSTRRDGG